MTLLSFKYASIFFLLGSGYDTEKPPFPVMELIWNQDLVSVKDSLFIVNHYLFEVIFENLNQTSIKIIRLLLLGGSWPSIYFPRISAKFLTPTISWSASQYISHCLWFSKIPTRKVTVSIGVILLYFPFLHVWPRMSLLYW